MLRTFFKLYSLAAIRLSVFLKNLAIFICSVAIGTCKLILKNASKLMFNNPSILAPDETNFLNSRFGLHVANKYSMKSAELLCLTVKL